MNLADLVAVLLVVALCAYALLAGADFGAGFWDLIAGGDKKGERPRSAIERAISPVWEVNHTWLIFALVILWTAFPPAFAAIMSSLFVPLALAAFGIVARGAGFAFRKSVVKLRYQRLYGAIFASSSLITPFFMGCVVGAVADGQVQESSGPAEWTGPLSLLIGVLFVVVGAFLAACYLRHDARLAADNEMLEYFSKRALIASAVAGAVAAVGLLVVHERDTWLFNALFQDALLLVAASLVCGAVAFGLLVKDRAVGVRRFAAAAVLFMILAWAAAQYPYILPRWLTVNEAAATDATLIAVLVVAGAAALLVAPAIALLFTLQQKQRLGE